jgi:uncharacterized protein YqjF (DUF2071 family)
MADRPVFLSAEWRDLVMLNYQVDPSLLQKYIPHGVELDTFEGRTFVSVVGFRFLRTKLFGFLAMPFHSNFAEVNLRFYVRRHEGGEDRRGVVFIRELVPSATIAAVARMIYGEKYMSCPMRHQVVSTASRVSASYEWRFQQHHFRVIADAEGAPAEAPPGSFENFITEHYWGYSVRNKGAGLEYRVSHPPWKVWTAAKFGFEGDAGALYGPEFSEILRQPAKSAFIAGGSSVVVHMGREISKESHSKSRLQLNLNLQCPLGRTSAGPGTAVLARTDHQKAHTLGLFRSTNPPEILSTTDS